MDISDKENTVEQASGNLLNAKLLNTKRLNYKASNTSNGKLRNNKIVKQKPGLTRLARVPLGGKDQNIAVPSLQRSQSSTHSFGDSKSQVKRLHVNKAPGISRSNSSLGFVYRQDELRTDKVNKSKHHELEFTNGALLDPHEADRAIDLVRPEDTDDLQKQDVVNPENVLNLLSTITERTEVLNARHLPITRDAKINVDPLKNSYRNKTSAQKTSLLDKSNGLIEKLAEDEDSIEIVPKKRQHLPYTPLGFELITQDELATFIGRKTSMEETNDVLNDPNDITSEHFSKEDIDLDFDYDNVPELPERNNETRKSICDDEIGLSTSDLNALLDF